MKNKELLLDTLHSAKNLATKDPQKSFRVAKDVLDQCQEDNCRYLVAEAYFHMAYACRVMSEYANGLEYSFKAKEIYEIENDNEGILKILNLIGIIYFYYGDYVSANDKFVHALNILELVDNPHLRTSVLNNLGEIHRLSEQWELANEFYFEALELAMSIKLDMNASIINLNISEIYYQLEEREKSIRYLETSYNLAIKEDNYIALGEIETKYGRIMFEYNDFNKSREYYLSALSRLNKINNKFYLIDLYINMSILEEATGGNPLNYLIEALEITLKLGLQLRTSEVYRLLGEYHERHHLYKQALEYFRLFYRKEKELEARNLATKLEIMSLEFNYDNLETKSQMFQKLSEKFKKEIAKSKEELKAIRIQNSLLITQNSIDELTQIYNRRGIHHMLSEKTKGLGLDKYVVLILDIDYFKKYNDSWGHIQGDICLKMISNSLKNLSFKEYFVGRFGGEEFLCFAKVKDIEEAYEMGETIRNTIKELKLVYSRDNNNCVTISVGGKVGNNDTDIDVLIKKADEQLYIAKDAGRNKVVVK